ncbi:hypothetical protein MMC14_009244 [Varicellaria rhodocarpa]|nr:hypothetical protein [Varicellaria rhodocarpa]
MQFSLLTVLAFAASSATASAITPRAALPTVLARAPSPSPIAAPAAAASSTIDAFESSINGVVSSAHAAATSALAGAYAICSSQGISSAAGCTVAVNNGKTVVNGKTLGSANAAATPAPMMYGGAVAGLVGAAGVVGMLL